MNIIEQCADYLKRDFPFVVYRKPNSKTIQAFFQSNQTLFATRKYNSSGFVFAPFNRENTSYLFPENNSTYKEEVYQKVEFEEPLSRESEFYSNMSSEKYGTLVRKAVNKISESELQKVVLSRFERSSIEYLRPIEVFQRLMSLYPSAFVYLWYHPKESMWLGATPETLVQIDGNSFYSMALAGTQNYMGNMDVEWGQKEKDEHQYVVEDIRNRLEGSNLEFQELKISKPYTVKAGNVLHLKADFNGKIGKLDLRSLITTLHPTPAVCGYPRNLAEEFIKNHEAYNREFYSGFLGEINRNNKSNLFVNLRCARVDDLGVNLYVGGGVTKDSIPEKEWLETISKTNTIKKAL